MTCMQVEIDLSSLGIFSTALAAVFSKLGVPIKTTIAPMVCLPKRPLPSAPAQELADNGPLKTQNATLLQISLLHHPLFPAV